MLKTTRSREFWLLAVVALLVLGAGLGLRDPWPADEPRFALIAQQMLDHGQWLFPHRGLELYSDKPPLFLWLQALAIAVAGLRMGFPLPSLLAALLTLWCVYDLGRRLWTPAVGRYAAWLTLLAFQFAFQAKRAQIDPLLVAWVTLANYGLLRHLLLGPDRRWWVTGWAMAGLGVITKGVGVLALLMLLPAAWARWRGWHGRAHRALARGGEGGWLRGPLAFLAVIAAWLLPMLLVVWASGDPEHLAYARDLLLHQTAGRYAGSWAHPKPWWYFGPVLLLAWLPLTLALPWALPAWWRRLRRGDARYLLPLAWVALVVVFFSFAAGKRDMYILPALPMLALATAPLLPGLLRRRDVRAAVVVLVLLLAGLFAVLGAGLLAGLPALVKSATALTTLGAARAVLAWCLIAVAAWAVVSLLAWPRARAVALASAITGVWVLWGMGMAPALNDASSARGVMQRTLARLPPTGQLGLVAWKEQNLLMARALGAGARTTEFGFLAPWHTQMARAMAWQRADPAQRWLLAQAPAVPPCVRRDRVQVIGTSNRREWWLLPGDALPPGCIPAAAGDAADTGD
jgi:4-amino-4-deoxy-L-arabinose transferase-like glycosyltransferase